MTLSFPNGSRSFDARRNLVCFWGYDSVLEISFFVDIDTLHKLNPQTRDVEAGYLEAFDAARERIHDIARKVYSRTRNGACFLAAADF